MRKFFIKHLRRIVTHLEQIEKLRLQLKRERLAALPFAKATQIVHEGKAYHMLEVIKPGNLVDILAAGIEVELPKPNWIGRASYSMGGKTPMLELTINLKVRELRLQITDEEIEALIESPYIVKKDSTEDEDGIFTRVRNVFIGNRPKHLVWSFGKKKEHKLVDTLYMSQYGPGSRIFVANVPILDKTETYEVEWLG
jgi:hypothetical protein